ncbi:hypothetical protein EIN_183230 [Entamoeba invadens IP1]|uniref:hypothetical protein n=1 Tax=Entamoeba invadens IP1 TaxID=370355 RepID=UPI0002C3D7FE|nr:hypothetical protein EIN_183230 [Entamoeba invadens IP1]ELP94056.1 hypothetical protein EIN_183230 [Entamoeba invadens IP1]|eukprot:XP_004260827.1 hypothetical protein EIN_183230 [Entamoeba invadens IP1]
MNMLFLLFILSQAQLELVNIFVGTENKLDEVSNGNVYPCIGIPYGKQCVTFQTEYFTRPEIFNYKTRSFYGFKITHQPSPWIKDYNSVLFTPTLNGSFYNSVYSSAYFVKRAQPNYAEIYVGGVLTKVTANRHNAVFTFYTSRETTMYLYFPIIEGEYLLQHKSDRTLHLKLRNGNAPKNYYLYATLHFSNDILSFECISGKVYVQSFEVPKSNNQMQNYCRLAISPNVTMTVSTSFLSHKMSDFLLDNSSFEYVQMQSEKLWQSQFDKVKIVTSNITRKSTFYTNLYRTMVFPHEISEGNIYQSPIDLKVHTGKFYNDFGYWDVARGSFPLITLLNTEIARGMLESTLSIFEQSGNLPQWMSPDKRECMVGNYADCAIADGICKNIISKDNGCAESYLKAMASDKKQERNNAVGRDGGDFFKQFGYVEDRFSGSVSKTLDYRYSDFCISRAIECTHRNMTIEEKKANRQRAILYSVLYDFETKEFRGKNIYGEFTSHDGYRWGDPFVEGGPKQYLFSVPHDIIGLNSLFGGNKEKRIESLVKDTSYFRLGSYQILIHEMVEMARNKMGQYTHGNEQMHHVLYVKENKEKLLRKVLTELYDNTTQGFCGDEDNGQMSSWYVLSSLGFYPVTLSTNQFVIGSPLFDKATVTLNDKVLEIDARNNSDINVYVDKIEVNGTRYTKTYFEYDLLMGGGSITFYMRDSFKRRKLIESDKMYSVQRDSETTPLKTVSKLRNMLW